MSVRAGDIRQFTWYGRALSIKGGDANVNVDVGGFSNEAEPNGDGTMHVRQRRKLPGFSDLPVSVDDNRQDLEFIQGKADVGEAGPCTLTLASGVVYSGNLVPVGDIMKATGDGTLTLEGRGERFEQI